MDKPNEQQPTTQGDAACVAHTTRSVVPQCSRRGFFAWMTNILGAAAAVLLGVPLIGYLLGVPGDPSDPDKWMGYRMVTKDASRAGGAINAALRRLATDRAAAAAVQSSSKVSTVLKEPPAVITMSVSGALEARMSAAVVPRPARPSGVRPSVAPKSVWVRLSIQWGSRAVAGYACTLI